jgi:hypothetical protein
MEHTTGEHMNNGESAALRKLEERLDALDSKLDIKLEELTRSVLRIEGSMPTRGEVASEDAKRVLLETYTQAHAAMLDRIVKLESGPQRFLAYIGAATGCLGLAFVLLGMIVTVLIAYFTKH